MERTANEIQKERRKEIEDKANELIKKCDVATLTSINEKGYPRTCVLAIARAEGFSDVYFITSKRSPMLNLSKTEKHKNLFGVSSIEDFL